MLKEVKFKISCKKYLCGYAKPEFGTKKPFFTNFQHQQSHKPLKILALTYITDLTQRFYLRGRNNRECGVGARGLFVCSKSLGLVSSVTYLRGIPAPSAPFRQSHPKNPLAPIPHPLLSLWDIWYKMEVFA